MKMAETRGRFNIVKERLIDLISLSDAVLQPNNIFQHVHGDWKRSIHLEYRAPPTVSVRISPINIDDSVYGRIHEGPAEVTASDEEVMWTAHIHTSACTTAGSDRGKHVQDLAELIIDYLIAQRKNQSAYGIEDIYGISHRESDVQGQPYKFCRIIMSGRMLCKRYDA